MFYFDVFIFSVLIINNYKKIISDLKDFIKISLIIVYDSEFFNFLHIIYYMKINKNNFYDQVVLNIATLLCYSVEFSILLIIS